MDKRFLPSALAIALSSCALHDELPEQQASSFEDASNSDPIITTSAKEIVKAPKQITEQVSPPAKRIVREKVVEKDTTPALQIEESEFRLPSLVKTLPSESQTTGSTPLPTEVDDVVDEATNIRAAE